MNFSNDKAIYVQIAERLSDEILAGKYKEDERIPSVREYAVLLEVNANTAVKAYDLLATDEISDRRRGLGYFVSAEALITLSSSVSLSILLRISSRSTPPVLGFAIATRNSRLVRPQ